MFPCLPNQKKFSTPNFLIPNYTNSNWDLNISLIYHHLDKGEFMSKQGTIEFSQ